MKTVRRPIPESPESHRARTDGESLDMHGEDRSNGLRRFAGTWSLEEFKQFEEAVAPLGEIDEEVWA